MSKIKVDNMVKIITTCNCFGDKQSQVRDKYIGKIGEVITVYDGYYEVSMDEYQPDYCFASKVKFIKASKGGE